MKDEPTPNRVYSVKVNGKRIARVALYAFSKTSFKLTALNADPRTFSNGREAAAAFVAERTAQMKARAEAAEQFGLVG
jgi:hypothetical protein